MRQLTCWCLSIALFPALLHAGQIYGSVSESGKGVPKAAIEVNCGGETTQGSTADDGSYRISVPQQGQCSLSLSGYSGRPSATVFSYPNPQQYDFELAKRQNGSYELRRK